MVLAGGGDGTYLPEVLGFYQRSGKGKGKGKGIALDVGIGMSEGMALGMDSLGHG